MAAGARLEAMRRRVRLSRVAAWTVIAAGPVALCIALAPHPTTVEAAAAAKPAAVRTAAASAADPAGFAQLFVRAWLRSSADDATSAQARLAQSMAPNVDLPQPAADAQSTPEAVMTLRSAQAGGGGWVVTVAAQYADGWVRYYTVPVAADRAGNSFTVTGAPGAVAGPVRAAETPSPYDVIVPDGDLSAAVGEFLAAYLTGAGEVDRYLAPGVKLTAISPPPYQTVTVQQISAAEEAAAAEKVPPDGTTVRIYVTVEARDSSGRWPLGYQLTLKARSGRWEIAALESGDTASDGRLR
ncbi:conjugal transfer protein [Streptomyces sp. NPDC101225]|uniref:conjugal transfer protein n=1 Tax=Streptomyces sp. NPDC101225 TaxID=3366135 RepID=UPI003827DD7E